MSTNIDYVLKLKDQFSGTFGKFDKGAAGVDSKINKMSSSFSGLGAAVAAIGIGVFASEILRVGSSYESMRIQLKNLTGSAEAGNAAFNRLKKDAETSTFGVEELVQANAMIMTTGISADQARKDMQNLGNAINYAGKGNDEFMRMAANMQQIKNIGKATAMDIKQFGFAGINIYGALAAATGKSTDQVKGMEVSYETLSKALEIANQKGGIFYGGSSSMADSTAVKISNLNDKLYNFYDTLFRNMKPLIDGIMNGISFLMDKMMQFGRFLKNNINIVYAFVAALGAVTAIYAVINALQLIMALTNPFALMVIGIAAAIALVVYLYKEFENVRIVLNSIGGVMKGLGQLLWAAISGPFKMIGALAQALMMIARGDFKGAFNKAYDTGAEVVKDKIDAYKSIFNAVTTADKKDYLSFGGGSNPLSNLTGGEGGSGASNLLTGNSSASSKASSVGGIAGGKPTSVIINIDSLIKENVNQVNNVTGDGLQKFEKMLTEALLRMVNDSQIAIQ